MLAAIRERNLDRARADGAEDPRSATTCWWRKCSRASVRWSPGSRLARSGWCSNRPSASRRPACGNLYVVPYIERDAPRWKEGYARLFIVGRDVPCAAPPIRTARSRPRVPCAAAGGRRRADAPVLRIGVSRLDSGRRPRTHARVGLHHWIRAPSAASITRSRAPARMEADADLFHRRIGTGRSARTL